MSVFSAELQSNIKSLVDRYETKRSSILPILHAIQDEHGYIKEEHIDELEETYGLHRVHVKEVITFYDVYHNDPVPKNLIRYCKNLTCHMLGAREAIGKIHSHIDEYKKKSGGECPIGIEEFPCLGKCDGAPVMLVGKKRYEHMTADKVTEVLNEYAPLK